MQVKDNTIMGTKEACKFLNISPQKLKIIL